MELLKIIAAVLVFCGLIFGGCAWQIYAYKDCKAIGHSTAYCVLRFGNF